MMRILRILSLLALFVALSLKPVVARADWPAEVFAEVRANPLIADINGDGKNDVVIATLTKQDEARVHIFNDAGSPLAGWPKSIFDENKNSMINNEGPAVADFNGDGKQEICFASGWQGPGKVHLLDYKGDYLPGWPVAFPGKALPCMAPVIADVNGDGKQEIIVGATDNKLYAYSFDGSIISGWPRETRGRCAGVVVGDINGDGKNAVIAWTDSYRLYGWQADGSALWPIKTLQEENIESCVVADINNDGNWQIIAGTNKGRIYIWDAQTLWPLAGWEKPRELGEGNVKVSLADINNDKKLEIVANLIGRKEGKYTGNGAVHVIKSDGSTLSGWPQKLTTSWIDSGIVLVDTDGDNRLELIGNSRDGKLHLWRYNGEYVEGYPMALFGNRNLVAGMAIGDVNGDGFMDAIVTYYNAYNKAFLVKFTGACEPKALAWPRATYNNQNNMFVINR